MKYDESTPKKSVTPNQPKDSATPTNTKSDDRTPVAKRTSGEKESEGDNDNDSDNYRGYKRKFAPSYTLYEKMSKENAEYRQGMPFEHCGKCNYYSGGNCKIVRGTIAASMVCSYFSEKYNATFSFSIRK